MIIIVIVIVIKILAITNIPIHDDHNHNPDNIVNGDSYHDMSTNDKKHHNRRKFRSQTSDNMDR